MSENPERALALTYAPHEIARQALSALLALDDRLAETVRTTSEPMLGQIRLKWWHDALRDLNSGSAPAEPVLQAVARDVVARGITGDDVAALTEAWAVLLEGALDTDALDRFADRGRVLFQIAGRVAGADADDQLRQAGEGWALGDLALGLSDANEATMARVRAEAALDAVKRVRWSRNARALGALTHLRRLDLVGSRVGSPRRVGRLLWHRLTGL